MTVPGRHIVRVAVSVPLLVQMMKAGYQSRRPIRTVEGLPESALFVGSFTEPSSHTAWFVFSDPSFDVVEFGAVIPVRNVTLKEYGEVQSEA